MVHTCPIWVYPVWKHISIYCDVRLSLGLGYWSSYSQGQLFEGKISELWGNIKARKGWRKVRISCESPRWCDYIVLCFSLPDPILHLLTDWLSCSVQWRVELVPEGVPSYAVEEEINVILKADQKIFLNVTLGPVQNGKQGNGAR